MTDDLDPAELRRTLSEYADGAPHRDPRPGFARALARRRRTRTAFAGGATLALVAVAVLFTVTRAPGPNDRLATGEAPSESPGTTLSPSGTPSPTATATPSDTPSGTPSVSPAGSQTGPAAGPDNLHVTLALDADAPATAEYALLRVRGGDPDAYPYVDRVAWGDGDTFPLYDRSGSHAWDCGPGGPPATSGPGTLSANADHAWRHPGTYTVEVTVSSWTCGTSLPQETATFPLRVVVRAGEVTSNGPRLPGWSSVHVNQLQTGPSPNPLRVVLSTMAHDDDGYFPGGVIDWGDGTSTPVGPKMACDDGGGRYYPHRTDLYVDGEHTYDSAGTYTVTIRATSTGCDGGSPQKTAKTVTVTVPKPQPQPQPSPSGQPSPITPYQNF
jgi:hypothetical protein